MNLGQRLKKLRKSLNLTQKQFASRVLGRVDDTYIGKIERGQQYPSLKLLERIGKVYSVPISYFFEENKEIAEFKLRPDGLPAKPPICPMGTLKGFDHLQEVYCRESECAWWDEGRIVDEDGTRGPGQCIIWIIADILRRKL